MRTKPPPVDTLQNNPVLDPALPQTDDLPALLNLLPPAIAERVRQIDRSDELLEVVMDVGRVPAARYLSGEVELAETKLTVADIQAVVAGLREFDSDNRSGIERTLHRISAIRNRQGKVIGLTCRVGRAVYGTTQIVEDLMRPCFWGPKPCGPCCASCCPKRALFHGRAFPNWSMRERTNSAACRGAQPLSHSRPTPFMALRN